jgi:hypothetical protein
MSRLKISENLFLEVNELNRLVKFIVDDGYKRLIKPMINSFGIVRNQSDDSSFKVIKSGNNIVVKSGLAFTKNLEAIVSKEDVQYTLSGIITAGTKKWVILSRDVTNYEDGSVNLSSDGSISGTDTEFSKVLRGQPNFPTRIKFGLAGGDDSTLDSRIQNNDFEVVRVNNDESALIVGDFPARSGLNYKVVGTFTPGFTPSEENKYIYEYDSYKIDIVVSDTKPEIEDGEQFILACITYTANGFTVSDERDSYAFSVGNYITQSEEISEANINSIIQVNKIQEDNISVEYEVITSGVIFVSNYTITQNSGNTIFQVNSCSNNLLGNNPTFADGLLNGWYILNKSNMRRMKIINNVGNSLYIDVFNSDFESSDQNVIIIPPFEDVEFEVVLNNSVNLPSAPFYFKFSCEDIYNRFRFYYKKGGNYTSTNVFIKTRFVEDKQTHQYTNMQSHTFSFNGNRKSYSGGKFVIGYLEDVQSHQSFNEAYDESYN